METLSFNLAIEDKESGLAVRQRVQVAVKKKEVATKQPTWEEVWNTGYDTHTGRRKAGIFQTKVTDSDRAKLLEVKHAIEAGEIGTGVVELKKFSKAHALNLYKMLVETRKVKIIADMVKNCPSNYHLIVPENEDLWNTLLLLLRKEEVIGLDTETNGVGYFHGDHIVGLSMSLPKADFHCYIPIRHNVESDQYSAEEVFSNLKPFLENPKLGKVLHNAKFDYHMFSNEGIYLQGIVMDTMVAMHVLNENETSYALKNLATKYGKFFGFEDKSMTYEELFGKGGFENTPLDIANVYACKDTHLCLKFREWILSHMNKQPKLYDVYHKEENEVLKVSIAMEQNGFKIDLDFAENYRTKLEQQVSELEEQLNDQFDGINVGSNLQLSAKIYDEWGVPADKGRSVDADTLKYIYVNYQSTIPQVAGIKTLLEYRELHKLLSTYIEPLPKKIGLDGRLHGQFNQSRTVTGRYASQEPNLQNLPKDARKLIVAPEGKLIIGIDFSQIEPRILAHITGDKEFRRPYLEGTDLYATLASKTFKKPIEECGDGSKYRKMMKTGLLATMYGTSNFTLAQQLGITVEEAENFIQDFLHAYPVVASWIDQIHNFVDQNGYVETLYGRKRRFIGHKDIATKYNAVCAEIKRYNNGEMPSNIWECKTIPYKVRNAYWGVARDYGRVQRQSVNAIIQGTGSQIMKRAMIGIYNHFETMGADWKVLATIHDEVLLEVPDTITPEQIAYIEDIMKTCVTLAVPMKVDTEVMTRWGEGVPKKEWIDAGCGTSVFK